LPHGSFGPVRVIRSFCSWLIMAAVLVRLNASSLAKARDLDQRSRSRDNAFVFTVNGNLQRERSSISAPR